MISYELKGRIVSKRCPDPPAPPSVQPHIFHLPTGVWVPTTPPPGTSPRNSLGSSPGKLRNCGMWHAPPPHPAQGGSSGPTGRPAAPAGGVLQSRWRRPGKSA